MLRTLQALDSYFRDEKLLELIIVEETDNPQPLTGEKVRYFPIPERGYGFAYARNIGLRASNGRLIVFIDDDVIPADNWLSKLIEPLDDSSVGAVGGPILPDRRELNEIGKAISLLGFPAGGLPRYLESLGRVTETNLISTGNCAFRADLARRTGGFDECLRWGGEDQDFFQKISQISKAIFTTDAIVYHRQRDSLKQVFAWFIRRGKADFFRTCKVHHPLKAVFSPLRSNFSLKLTAFVAVLFLAMSYSSLTAIAFAVVTPLAWGAFLWLRANLRLSRKTISELPSEIVKIRDLVVDRSVGAVLFPVKFVMDVGHEIGKLSGLMNYLLYRTFAKPLVLTFHHLGSPSQEDLRADLRYYYTLEAFQSLVKDCGREGRRIVSPSELIRRLKKNPRSLYFDKTVAITFDDAYSSLYRDLKSIFPHGSLPIAIFVPTAHAGKNNEWDLQSGHSRESILNWQQLATLKGAGANIGSHSRHHFKLTKCDSDDRRLEIYGSLEDLKKALPDASGILFSYPYGAYDNEIKELVKNAGYIGAVVNFAGNIRPRTDPFEIPRFTVFAGNDWKSISHLAKSLWLKELLKDIRDCLRKQGFRAGRGLL